MIGNIQQLKSGNRGFTLIEMVVVISLFAIMAGLVLFKYNDYTAEINLENTAQDVALQIQQAENFAIAGQYPAITASQAVPGAWRPSYGVYFDSSSAHQKSIISFFDSESYQPTSPAYLAAGVNGRGYLDDPTCPLSGECLNTLTIDSNASIVKICQGDMATCNLSSNQSLGQISLVFTRPFPDLLAFVTQGNTETQVSGADIRIRVQSDENASLARDIVITQLGQIHIETVTP